MDPHYVQDRQGVCLNICVGECSMRRALHSHSFGHLIDTPQALIYLCLRGMHHKHSMVVRHYANEATKWVFLQLLLDAWPLLVSIGFACLVQRKQAEPHRCLQRKSRFLHEVLQCLLELPHVFLPCMGDHELSTQGLICVHVQGYTCTCSAGPWNDEGLVHAVGTDVALLLLNLGPLRVNAACVDELEELRARKGPLLRSNIAIGYEALLLPWRSGPLASLLQHRSHLSYLHT
mmetsp:Transcript_28683/g.52235  ORF Transcript_28683/g.52235 Transcript_28683/m.52235 type:complete len:233 (-) Transcript_28683:13-711(-)